MDAGIQCDSCEQCRKKKISREKHNSKLSSESPYSILHIASISLCIIFSIQTVRRRRGNEITESSTQHRTESNNEGQFNCDRVSSNCTELNNDAPIQYCTQVIIQIYTDSGVMYKNENGRNLRHYARVFSISRLHLSSKKLADNTKGHLKFFKTIS